MKVSELLAHNLGLVDLEVPAMLDWDPPAAMLTALAERTGVDLARLQAMTLAGWVPWLFDSLTVGAHQAQDVFDTYVWTNSVLLQPGEAGRHQVGRWKSWRGAWLSGPFLKRVCPMCARDPDRGEALVWTLPLMIGCVEHGCRLENTVDVNVAVTLGRPLPVVPVDEPVATMDRYTYEALTTGLVVLPGRTVHAGVWFRLLRSLLNELSQAATTLNTHGKTTLGRSGRPPAVPSVPASRCGARSNIWNGTPRKRCCAPPRPRWPWPSTGGSPPAASSVRHCVRSRTTPSTRATDGRRISRNWWTTSSSPLSMTATWLGIC
jgi:hypothetical protein